MFIDAGFYAAHSFVKKTKKTLKEYPIALRDVFEYVCRHMLTHKFLLKVCEWKRGSFIKTNKQNKN